MILKQILEFGLFLSDVDGEKVIASANTLLIVTNRRGPKRVSGSGLVHTFMFSLLNTLAREKMPKGILLIRLCSMLRE